MKKSLLNKKQSLALINIRRLLIDQRRSAASQCSRLSEHNNGMVSTLIAQTKKVAYLNTELGEGGQEMLARKIITLVQSLEVAYREQVFPTGIERKIQQHITVLRG